ncbi:MAG: glycosyltransferase family 4 protein [Kouleothrix sp.]|jgi:glycosyltransferase involved in cell wall biosynthesis|nr:glycosyltransferase family 4 protein [Kouleothrix sp.]
MHIAINAHLLAHTRSFRRAGVSNYVEALLTQLGQIDHTNRYSVYTTRGLSNADLGLPPNFSVKPSRLPTINPRLRIPWEQLYAPLMLRASHADVFHGVLNVAPTLSGVPSVITIHDLAFLSFPQTFRRVNRSYLTWATRVSARRATRILAVSEATKREIVRLLGVPPEKIIVTYDACDARFTPPDAARLAAFRQRAGLPERFILFLGTLEPRKNLPTLLEAYARIASATDAPLLIGGGKGWLYDEIFAKAEALNLGDRVRFVGYIDAAEQALWYAAATVFAFPSLYEGFGMPPLEAMACGTPVVTSTSSSLPEVVGEAGLTADPGDPDAIGAALLRVLRDADLRADLRERGLRQARRFSWRDTAERTLGAYQAAAGSRAPLAEQAGKKER